MTKNSLFLFLCCILTGTMQAQEEKTLPGNVDLPSSAEEFKKIASFDEGAYDYAVSDYFARPKQSSFQFSPSGKYFSYREKDEKKIDCSMSAIRVVMKITNFMQ